MVFNPRSIKGKSLRFYHLKSGNSDEVLFLVSWYIQPLKKFIMFWYNIWLGEGDLLIYFTWLYFLLYRDITDLFLKFYIWMTKQLLVSKYLQLVKNWSYSKIYRLDVLQNKKTIVVEFFKIFTEILHISWVPNTKTFSYSFPLTCRM